MVERQALTFECNSAALFPSVQIKLSVANFRPSYQLLSMNPVVSIYATM